MTYQRLAFGEMTVTGELARGIHPADELGLRMAMALGRPDDPHPPFAVVPVLFDGFAIGRLERIEFVWGGSVYQFRSESGNTNFCCSDKHGVLQRLSELLGLQSQPANHQ